MEAFATVEDYEARYGESDDPERVETLLGDAAAFIASQPGFERRVDDEVQAANLVRVTCAVVNRSLSAGDLAGFSQFSQTAGSYNASVSLSNPSGDFYLTKAEKAALGIGGARIGQTNPYAPWGGFDG